MHVRRACFCSVLLLIPAGSLAGSHLSQELEHSGADSDQRLSILKNLSVSSELAVVGWNIFFHITICISSHASAVADISDIARDQC
jgi:hypothetical protein